MLQEELLLSNLINKGFLKPEIAKALLEEAHSLNKRLEELILERNLIDEKNLLAVKSEVFNLPIKIFQEKETVPNVILNIIPEDVARHYKMIAFNREGNILEVGMVYPDDFQAQRALKFLAERLGFQIKVFLISHSDFLRLLKLYQTFTEEFFKLVDDFQKRYASIPRKKFSPYKIVDLESTAGIIAEEAPIVKLFASILKYGVRARASDIHIEPTRSRIRVRMRIDGNLVTVVSLPLAVLPAIISRVKIMTNLKIDETRLPQDGRFTSLIDEKEIDFRVSTFPTALGEKVAIRILDPTTGLKNIQEIGLNDYHLEIIKVQLEKPYGMILITGPTGSGKTTTLYAMLQILNDEKINIISLEDPVEYTVEGINQSQVLPEIGYTFARGLRHIVRQDPDVIMVGEIRDHETADLATHAALTGHLVLSTLHTNNALGVIPRLLDLGVEPFLIPSSLNLMMAQRLVRKLCPECKQKVEATPLEEKVIDEALKDLPEKMKEKLPYKKPYFIYKSKGCPSCNKKGYLGRIGIFEMVEMTPELEEIILTGPSQDKLNKEAKRQGMIKLRQDGILKALEGITSLEEVLSATSKD
ncbi:MAG: GspE/PulE family protein [Candidatus Paceibacterota bacterium]